MSPPGPTGSGTGRRLKRVPGEWRFYLVAAVGTAALSAGS